MRIKIAILSLICVTLGAIETRAATTPVMPQTMPQPMPATSIMPPMLQADQESGVSEETPNQRRKRLGQEITASYPPLDTGEAIETPNQRRHRLGQPIEASYETQVSGVAEETPNQHRARLGQQQP